MSIFTFKNTALSLLLFSSFVLSCTNTTPLVSNQQDKPFIKLVNILKTQKHLSMIVGDKNVLLQKTDKLFNDSKNNFSIKSLTDIIVEPVVSLAGNNTTSDTIWFKIRGEFTDPTEYVTATTQVVGPKNSSCSQRIYNGSAYIDSSTSQLGIGPITPDLMPNGVYTISFYSGSIKKSLDFTIDNIQGLSISANPQTFSPKNKETTTFEVGSQSGDEWNINISGNGKNLDIISCIPNSNGVIWNGKDSSGVNFPDGTYTAKAYLKNYPSVYSEVGINIGSVVTPTATPSSTPIPTDPPILDTGCSCDAPISTFTVKGKPCNTPCMVNILPYSTKCRSKVEENGVTKEGNFFLGAIYDIDKNGPDLTGVIYPTPVRDSSGKRAKAPDIVINNADVRNYWSNISINNTSTPNISGDLVIRKPPGTGQPGSQNGTWNDLFMNDTATNSLGLRENISDSITRLPPVAAKIVQDYKDRGFEVPVPENKNAGRFINTMAINLSNKIDPNTKKPYNPPIPNVTDSMNPGQTTQMEIKLGNEKIAFDLKMTSKSTTTKNGVTYSKVTWQPTCK